MLTTGFQATNVGLAIEEINRMLAWRLSDRPISENDSEENRAPEVRQRTRATIFLSYTSNMISCGMRETIKFLVQHKLVDVLCTTAGGIEEDFIKCLAPTFLGDWKMKGRDLRAKGINRIGNLLVPNENYCKFEDWLMPILHKMADEAEGDDPVRWTPSTFISRLGKEIDNEESVYYWAWKNSIPVFCPALTDGSIGDMLYFFNYKRPEFVIDIIADIRAINDIAVRAHATGMVILGGGVIKHHVCNANLMRNGADFSVYINTGQEFDGSDCGASPDEAVSWGKIKLDAKPVKVCADATLVFPIIVSQTFYKEFLRAQVAKSGF
jgi:deoxyhypusine synthase